MNALFIELYLEEDVRALLAALLRAHGFTALNICEAGPLHTSEAEPLAYAINQRKAFLTHHRADFEVLAKEYVAARQPHSGIMIAVRHPAQGIVRRLLRILNQVTADEKQDQVRYR